jgi:hypothetical protein
MRSILDTTLCDKGCQWLVAGRWFSPSTPVFSTNKTDRHDITEILLKVVLNTITLTPLFLHNNNSNEINNVKVNATLWPKQLCNTLCVKRKDKHKLLMKESIIMGMVSSVVPMQWEWIRVRVMVVNPTFNNISVISVWSVLLVEETGDSGKKHRPATSHW